MAADEDLVPVLQGVPLDTLAVDENSVEAVEIDEAPAFLGIAHLGMPAADRSVVQHDLQAALPAGTHLIETYLDSGRVDAGQFRPIRHDFAPHITQGILAKIVTTPLLPHGLFGVFTALPFAIWFYLALEGVAMSAEGS